MIELSKDTLYVRGEDGTFRPVNAFMPGGGAYVLPTASADTLGGVKVGEGLQMDGDVLGVKPEGAYELIETITVDEAVKTIARYNKPNGARYNFESVKVEVVVPAAETQCYVTLDYMTVAERQYGGFYISDGVRTSVSRYMIFITPVYDNLLGYYTNPVTNDYDTIRWWIPAVYRYACRKKSPIIMLNFVAYAEFPAGTVISIFGVEANA